MWFEEYIQENKDLFLNRVKEISVALDINPNWLMAVMMFESSLNHRAVNKISNATGLIQFMPKTATSLGVTVSELKAMSNYDQLLYVYEYLKSYKNKMNSLTDVYFAVFFPAAIGKPDDWVLKTSSLSAATIAKANPIFDLNGDGRIQVYEVKQYFENWLKKKIIIVSTAAGVILAGSIIALILFSL
ncbi:transglycosylase SLT domain-containing protein [Bacteroidales bacterium OttesenSCG-928-I21]|nr:transglycosylase SLT domain-containing protein [Bacteroidales bacterium OttesenSCG-928-I21]